MSDNESRVLRIVRKLLDLAGNNPNEAEARSAAEKAHALLLEHNLDMQAVRASGGTGDSDYVKHTGYHARVRTPQQKFILPLLQQFFHIRVVRSRERRGGDVTFYFVGTRTNVMVAQYVHDFLNQKFPDLWRQYKAANQLPENAKQSYYAGLALGLSEQLEASKQKVESSKALVLVPDPGLVPYMQSQFGKTGRARMSRANLNDAEAMAAGREEGRNLRIHRGLESSPSSGGPTLRIGGRK